MTSLIYSEEYKKHDRSHHPENQGRLDAIVNSLKNEGIWNDLDIVSPLKATEDDLLRVHTKDHVEYIKKFCKRGGGNIDYDTYATPETYEIAKLAAGGAMKASEIVLSQKTSAYSIARPPGHHATSNKSMGFCIFNNLAIALEYLRNIFKIKKFFILDFDVHFGNETSQIFYNDPDVLYISIHQNPKTLYPGDGFIEEIGAGKGEGHNINIPMPPRSASEDYIYILEDILSPVASKFNADFYFLDVGLDGHIDDPISNLRLTDDFYEYTINKMGNIAGPMALILEGGYNLNVLSRCNVKMINALNNIKEDNYTKEELNVSDECRNTLKQIKDIFSVFYEF